VNAILIVVTVAAIAAALLLAAVAWRMAQDNRERSEARVAALAGAIHDSGTERSIFGDQQAAVRHPSIRFAVAGAMTLAIAATAAFQLMPAGPALTEPALELMSMRHTRDGEALTVMGLVRNPSSGAPTARVSAVVAGFDRDGTLLHSSRAPIDFVTLAPGEESPFVVTLPQAAGIGRYRVTFMTEQGIIRHVDRRADPVTLAADGRQRS
jgi:hypothetical protein